MVNLRDLIKQEQDKAVEILKEKDKANHNLFQQSERNN